MNESVEEKGVREGLVVRIEEFLRETKSRVRAPCCSMW